MTEKKKVVVKTGSRSGKSLVKKALVVKKSKKVDEKVSVAKATEGLKSVDTKKKEIVKENKRYNLTIGLKDLLAAGSHLGHKVSKTHPKALENIYTQKDGVQVFDLIKTLEALERACNFIYNSKRNGKQIVLVGTKRQAKEVVRRVAREAGVPYVTDRWLGGTISNWDQIKKNVKKLTDLREGLEKGKFADATKKELSQMNKEIVRLERIVGGLVGVDKFFDILFVVDGGFERTAIKEARLRNVKVIGIIDSDANPFRIDLAIPANDDSVKSVTLIVEEIGKAIKAAGVK